MLEASSSCHLIPGPPVMSPFPFCPLLMSSLPLSVPPAWPGACIPMVVGNSPSPVWFSRFGIVDPPLIFFSFVLYIFFSWTSLTPLKVWKYSGEHLLGVWFCFFLFLCVWSWLLFVKEKLQSHWLRCVHSLDWKGFMLSRRGRSSMTHVVTDWEK